MGVAIVAMIEPCGSSGRVKSAVSVLIVSGTSEHTLYAYFNRDQSATPSFVIDSVSREFCTFVVQGMLAGVGDVWCHHAQSANPRLRNTC